MQSLFTALLHPSKTTKLYTMAMFSLVIRQMKTKRIILLISSYPKCNVDNISITEQKCEPKNGYFPLNMITWE